ncbi:MAG TPA: NTP transferase domain-containing protein, partial [Trueperaceae bacterium]
MTRPLAVVVLAAGLGTRMKSRVPKMLHEAAGRPLLEHVLRAVQPLAPDKILVVVGHGAGAVRERFAAYPATFVVQEEQLGTGHALLQCRPELADFGGEVLVVNGDMPLLTTETLQALLARQHETRAAMSLVTCEVAEPDGLGRIVRKADGSVAAIVEEKDAGPRERAIREINPGAYLFGPDVFKRIQELSNDNAQGEY